MNQVTLLQSKILSFSELKTQTEQWRNNQEKIVFTNGCFDLLHLGHVDYLAKARDLGNRLVIGLNTDRSVQNIKGPSRPVKDELSRAHILAAMGFVDAVVLFDEETPMRLITLVNPDVLVKGGDYAIKDIVGHESVQKNGGNVCTIPFVEGYSSTRIIDKINQG